MRVCALRREVGRTRLRGFSSLLFVIRRRASSDLRLGRVFIRREEGYAWRWARCQVYRRGLHDAMRAPASVPTPSPRERGALGRQEPVTGGTRPAATQP